MDDSFPPNDPLETTMEIEEHPTPTVGASRSAGYQAHQTPIDGVGPLYQPGRQIGRYVVLGHLGAGGMGVVYAAYDPRLDRKIALKLLRPRPGGRDSALEARLLREAQALAKLSDPHVLTVFDVGTYGEQIFLAVEYVEGTNLAQWLRQESRSQRQILDVFIQAGKGLAAAHRKGLVHRDFKPGNVMVRAADDFALVLDFGLARSSAEPVEGESEVAAIPQGSKVDLTGFGAVMGTPAFMAPEQWEGRPATAATDQFSFCAALYAALYGSLPFEREAATLPPQSWVPKAAPDGHSVPARMRKILLRGLSVRQEDRVPSMDVLLRELAYDARRRRQWLAAAVVAGVVIALGVFRPVEPKPCSAAGQRIAEVWNPSIRAQVGRAFSSTGRAYAVPSAKAVAEILERYAQGWSTTYRDACEATHLRKDQSEALMDRRMACLEQGRRELQALVKLFIEQPGETLDEAIRAAGALSPLGRCSDSSALMAPMELPSDEESRARVDALRGAIAENRANIAAGRYGVAFERARELEEEARQSRYLPLKAEALFHLGRSEELLSEGEPAFENLNRAVTVAQAGNHEEIAAEAFVRLVRVAGYLEADFEAAEFFAELAEGSISRLDRGERLRAVLADHIGLLELERGNPEAAVARHLEALELKRAYFGEAHLSVARSLVRLGTVFHDLGRFEEAEQHLREALDMQRQSLGEHHPEVTPTLDRLGNVLYRMGDAASALEHFNAALGILRSAYGPDHPRVATTALHAASAHAELGHSEQALELYDWALRVLSESKGPDHPSVAAVWLNIGATRSRMGDYRGALGAYRQAVDIQERTLGNEHPNLAVTYFNLGEVWSELGDPGRAEKRHRQALALWRQILGEEHYLIGHGLTGLGRAMIDSGRPAEAEPLLLRALELWRDREQNPAHPAWTRWMLARALEQKEPSRAVSLAEQALEVFKGSTGTNPNAVSEIEAWLARVRDGD